MSWKTVIVAGLSLVLGGCVTGCAGLNAKPPIEAFANKLADNAIIPAVKQGLSQGVEQLTIQAGAQGINPTYVVAFAGKWVVGIEGQASVGVEGIAGQLQVSSAGGEKRGSDSQRTPSESKPAKPEDTAEAIKDDAASVSGPAQ